MKKLSALVILSYILLQPAVSAFALPIPNSAQNTVNVTPAIVQIALGRGQSSAGFDVTLTNDSSSSDAIYVSAQDFTALGENGAITFLNSSTSSHSHGLANNISLGLKQVALAPHTSQLIPVSIPNVSSLAPGGHYAALTYTVNPLPSSAKGNTVSNREVLSTLIFLTTYGSTTQSIKLDPVIWPHLAFSIPKSISLVFTNNGNSQTAPRGSVEVLNSANKIMSRGIINTGSGLVLPASSRLINVALKPQTKAYSPGTYHLKILYQADTAASRTYLSSFFYISVWIPVIIIILIVLIISILTRLLKRRYVYRAD